MHDLDDATLMQALRDADPVKQSALDANARHRLEQSWRRAADPSVDGNRTVRRMEAAHRRRLQLAAAAVVAIVVVAGGGVLSNVVGQRRAGMTGSAAGVEGSFRATVRYVGQPTIPDVTFDVVNGRVHARTDTPQREQAAWRGRDGLGEAAPVVIDEQIIAGDETYVHARTGEQARARWYRYTGSHAEWQPRWDLEPPRVDELTMPVFREGTRGFRRMEDAQAAAQGLTRYSAHIPTADIDFLGWFAPMRGDETSVATMDIWVDGQGRVQSVREQSPEVPGNATIMRFGQFDALRPIPLPSSDRDELAVATDVYAIEVVACGDPRFADTLRDRVEVELERSDVVVSYETFDASSPEVAHIDRHDTGDLLFVAKARLADDARYSDGGRLSERLQRLSASEAGAPPDTSAQAVMCEVRLEPHLKFFG